MVVENIGKPYGENWTSTYDSQLTQNATQKWIFLNVKYKIIKNIEKHIRENLHDCGLAPRTKSTKNW